MISKVVYIQNSTDADYPASNIMIVTDSAEKGTLTTCWTASGSYDTVSLGDIEHRNHDDLADKANELIKEMEL